MKRPTVPQSIPTPSLPCLFSLLIMASLILGPSGCTFRVAREYVYQGFTLTATGSAYTLSRTHERNTDLAEGSTYKPINQPYHDAYNAHKSPYYHDQALNQAELALRSRIRDLWIDENIQVEDLADQDKDYSDFLDRYTDRYKIEKFGETGGGSYDMVVSLVISDDFMQTTYLTLRKIQKAAHLKGEADGNVTVSMDENF